MREALLLELVQTNQDLLLLLLGLILTAVESVSSHALESQSYAQFLRILQQTRSIADDLQRHKDLVLVQQPEIPGSAATLKHEPSLSYLCL